jgi:hypothetical protein
VGIIDMHHHTWPLPFILYAECYSAETTEFLVDNCFDLEDWAPREICSQAGMGWAATHFVFLEKASLNKLVQHVIAL